SPYNGSTHEDVSRKYFELNGIKHGSAARTNDHRVACFESVIGGEFSLVFDIFKLALSKWRFQRKCPIRFALRCRTRQANNDRWDVLRQGQTAVEEFLGRPRLR